MTVRHLIVALAMSTPATLTGQATVTTLNHLSFGTIVAGTGSSVAPTDPGAAAWRIDTGIVLGTGFELTLPNALDRMGGGASLPITFCGTCGRYGILVSNPAVAIAFDPASPLTEILPALTSAYVWVGGSLDPPISQPAGDYTGTIVLTYFPII